MTKLDKIRVARVFTVPFSRYAMLAAQVEHLTQAGAEVSVISSPESPSTDFAERPVCNLFPIIIERDIHLAADLLALYKLIKLFRRERFHIVHSSTPKAGLLCALAGFLAKVPIRLHTYTGQPWVSLKGIKKKITTFSDKLIAKLNLRVYADSHSQCDFLIQHRIVKEKKISVLGAGSFTGVDTRRFNQTAFSEEQKEKIRYTIGIDKEAPLLLFVGRITLDKGIAELITAFRNVLYKVGNAVLLIVGPFEQDYENVIRALAKNVSEQQIIFLGFSAKPENYMAIADILCLPSYREGFGSVVIEAGAMGIPTVGSDIYGLQDAIVEGETGLLVEPKNSTALANALLKLISQPQLRLMMGENAKRRAIDLFDSQKISDVLIDEYQTLLKERQLSVPLMSK